MKASKTRWLGVLLVLALLLCLAPATTALAATTWYVDDDGGADFTTIQAAIDAAAEGDTIIVKDGTYNENLEVYTSNLVIQSENGRATTIIQAADPELDGIFILADDITIDGFTVYGVTAEYYGGITLYGDDAPDGEITGCVIKNNDCSNNDCGMMLFTGHDNTFENNIAGNCTMGLYLGSATNNLVTKNTFSGNEYGVALDYSTLNPLYLNNFVNNTTAHVGDASPNSSSGGIWDSSPTPMTYSYGGSEYTSYMGNYWNDYAGTDADGNGIGDTSYQAFADPAEYDDYPLMGPLENYSDITPGSPTPETPTGSGSAMVSGEVAENYISITAPDFLDMPLEKGTTNYVESSVDIESNIPWQLNVEDEKTDNKGYMVSTEDDVLQNPMMVNHDTTSVDLSTPGGGTLATGAGPESVAVEFEQQVEYTDVAGTYEITVTFSLFGTF
jgi:parallel beta-helix repeat protein